MYCILIPSLQEDRRSCRPVAIVEVRVGRCRKGRGRWRGRWRKEEGVTFTVELLPRNKSNTGCVEEDKRGE